MEESTVVKARSISEYLNVLALFGLVRDMTYVFRPDGPGRGCF